MKIKIAIPKIVLHLLLMFGGIASLFPFYWLTVTSTRTSSDVLRFPPILVPGNQFSTNVKELFKAINFFQSFLNTLFVAGVTTIAVLFFCSLGGFFFAKFKFPGNKWLFTLMLLSMMVPTQLSLVPLFIVMQKLKWVSTFKALIIPNIVNAFGIFWIRQYASGAIHDDMLNAGRIDGCSNFRLYWNLGLPILGPGLAFLGIFTFMNTWNNYLWPLIIINDSKKYVLQVALSQLNGIYYNSNYAMVMAGTLLATLPLIVMFLMFSKQFISDIAAGSIKG